MRTLGFSIKEGIAVGVLVLALVGLAWLAAVDAGRRARDTDRLSAVRQLQAAIEDFRRDRASYPSSLEGIAAAQDLTFRIGYLAAPADCSPELEQLCTGYELTFTLEGQVGTLSGGACSVSPSGVSCREP